MIAIGIMGVGITLVATIFPTALKQNEFSNNDTMGTLIAENGLAMAQALVTKSFMNATYPPSTPDTLHVIADEEPTRCAAPYPILLEQQHYPPDQINPYQGYVVLGRKKNADPTDENIYQLVVVSYAKRAGGTVKALPVPLLNPSALPPYGFDVASADLPKIAIGTPVIIIIDNSAYYAIVTGKNDITNKVSVDRPMPGTGTTAYVIVEEVSGNPAAKSPAIGTAVIETQLRP